MKFAKKVGVMVFLMILISVLLISGVFAVEPDCQSVFSSGGFSIQSRCTNDSDCDDGNECTLDKCICTTYCKHIFVDNTKPDTTILGLANTDWDLGEDYSSCDYWNSNYLIVVGESKDACSTISNVQYKKDVLAWDDTIAADGAFNELDEIWHTQPSTSESYYEDGEHTVCGKATDSFKNTETVNLSDDCCTFCVDTQDPEEVQNIVHSNPSECVSNYVNEAPEFEWDETSDTGCAGIDYYEVEVYYSDGELYYTTTTEDNSIIVGEPENGEDYYIKVRAVDKAGNKGDWSDESEEIYYDDEAPEVEITGEPWDEWYKDDFYVTEKDSDNLELWKCEIAISGDGSEPTDYTEVECNTEFLVDISEECPDDGLNICWIKKRVTDNACNQDKEGHKWDIDRNPPETNKTVSELKYPGPNILWPLVKWFVKPETTITLNCSDDGTGCNATFYRINNGNWTEYSSPFHLGEEDGIYYLEYYSIDNINNIEDIKNETDKIDTEAPETTKTLGKPKYNAGNKTWISELTPFNLTCQDSEVGCYKIYYRIDSGAQITYSEPFTLDGYEDGMHTIYYQSIDFLQNLEQEKNEIDWLDTTAPSIQILNPTEEEAESIERCIQSIVVIVNDGEGSGIKKVWAELWTVGEGSEKVREAKMNLTIYGTYETLMDKQLPAGEYILKVYAEDNIGNLGISEMEENLKEGVFVEYIEDPICKINPETGGECDFTFHICTRNSNAVSMKMKKLAEVVTPDMMNAEISKENETAFVYLWDPAITENDILKLSDEIINGRTSFDLHLDVPADVSSRIGKGEHKLDYLIESYSD